MLFKMTPTPTIMQKLLSSQKNGENIYEIVQTYPICTILNETIQEIGYVEKMMSIRMAIQF